MNKTLNQKPARRLKTKIVYYHKRIEANIVKFHQYKIIMQSWNLNAKIYTELKIWLDQ